MRFVELRGPKRKASRHKLAEKAFVREYNFIWNILIFSYGLEHTIFCVVLTFFMIKTKKNLKLCVLYQCFNFFMW